MTANLSHTNKTNNLNTPAQNVHELLNTCCKEYMSGECKLLPKITDVCIVKFAKNVHKIPPTSLRVRFD